MKLAMNFTSGSQCIKVSAIRSVETLLINLGITRPVANRAIAPTGSIGILAGTSTGVEPIFAVAYKRRYLKGGNKWHYQYVVDSAAQEIIDLYGVRA